LQNALLNRLDSLTDVPNLRQKGTWLGNWLTREQARELLAVPDRSTLKGRDYLSLALLVGCALRYNDWPSSRSRPSSNASEGGSWTTLRAKAGASALSPSRLGQAGINAWMTAAGIEDDRLLRSSRRAGTSIVGCTSVPPRPLCPICASGPQTNEAISITTTPLANQIHD
jgi:hypothetical protein